MRSETAIASILVVILINAFYSVNIFRNNKEFYVDTSINDAIKLGYNCKIFLVDSYLPWGNPNDLKTFKYWQEYFHLWKNHPYKIKKTI